MHVCSPKDTLKVAEVSESGRGLTGMGRALGHLRQQAACQPSGAKPGGTLGGFLIMRLEENQPLGGPPVTEGGANGPRQDPMQGP